MPVVGRTIESPGQKPSCFLSPQGVRSSKHETFLRRLTPVGGTCGRFLVLLKVIFKYLFICSLNDVLKGLFGDYFHFFIFFLGFLN